MESFIIHLLIEYNYRLYNVNNGGKKLTHNRILYKKLKCANPCVVDTVRKMQGTGSTISINESVSPHLILRSQGHQKTMHY